MVSALSRPSEQVISLLLALTDCLIEPLRMSLAVALISASVGNTKARDCTGKQDFSMTCVRGKVQEI